MAESGPVTPRAAGAIVLMRAGAGEGTGGGIAVFMVRRHVRSEFAPDVFVFPGGSVKHDDRETELAPDLCAPTGPGPMTLGSGFRVAALRECFEEAGVLLARRGSEPLAIGAQDAGRFAAYRAALQSRTVGLGAVARTEGLTLATDALSHWAHWITPEAFPLRFDTHFFLAAMPEGQEAAYDQQETTEGVWIAPEEALARSAAGDFPLVFATLHQLRALSDMRDVAQARARFAGTTPRTIMPRVTQRDGADVIVLPEEP
ncbi:MAG: NUDIX domain-containing protein [Ktedonobacterales bacterium]|nr:NUDIX domain-containing protein [Ktedonobacterales bacterium]